MVHRSETENSFEFVRVASLRAAQLMRGCIAHVEASKKAVVTAQREVALGLVRALPRVPSVPNLAIVPTMPTVGPKSSAGLEPV
jgi:DNA-directed RNA polymerase subunit K/omega